MGDMQKIPLSIYRYDPDRDEKPYMQDVEIEIPADSDLMVLGALHKIKEKDPSLSFRHSCREGVCGSDSMNINGRNGLACIISISSLKKPIVLRPLPGFPVVRDLVVNMEQFFRQYERIEPYLQNDEAPPRKRASTIA